MLSSVESGICKLSSNSYPVCCSIFFTNSLVKGMIPFTYLPCYVLNSRLYSFLALDCCQSRRRTTLNLKSCKRHQEKETPLSFLRVHGNSQTKKSGKSYDSLHPERTWYLKRKKNWISLIFFIFYFFLTFYIIDNY